MLLRICEGIAGILLGILTLLTLLIGAIVFGIPESYRYLRIKFKG